MYTSNGFVQFLFFKINFDNVFLKCEEQYFDVILKLLLLFELNIFCIIYVFWVFLVFLVL